jgi:Neutral/alkaline non-lysosomal ceramidase, N-terminal
LPKRELVNKEVYMLEVGFGRTDITPELGVRLGGYGVEHRPAEEILDNLHSTAMMLKEFGKTAVIINLDWVMISEDTTAVLRDKINLAAGVTKEHINISVSHTHSAPSVVSCWGWGDAEQEYVDSVLDAIVESVVMAQNNLQEVETGFAVTESLVGVSRRRITEEHGFDYTADVRGLFDHEMTVVRFKSNDKDIGIIVHYGAHCTAMGLKRLVSCDWCGVMKDRIEGQFKAPVLFLNGAIGEVGPRTNVRVGENDLAAGGGDGIDSVREVGYRAATDAIRALLSIKEWRKDLKLNVEVEDIIIPYAPLTPLKEAQSLVEKYEPSKDKYGPDMCEYKHNKAVIEAHKKKQIKSRKFTQSIIMLGPLAIVPFPGEVSVGITLRIKHGSPFLYTLSCSITNGYWSYLHTREAIHREQNQIFEIWSTKMINAYLFADNIDDVLVEQNLKILRKCR